MRGMNFDSRQFKRIGFIALWAISLLLASQWGHAQNRPSPFDKPGIIFGNDLGFQVDQNMGDRITGTLVVKVNGEWVRTAPPSPLRSLPVK